uniref:Sidoreflexin n=2 Tax=Caenorhabditis japonica TaxID=281687 RepID=A0A8R1DNS2_CAEJA
MTLFASKDTQEKCRQIVLDYKKGKISPDLTVDELWNAKILYDSMYHPDTGEKMFFLGRMSAQMPANMVITGLLLSMYRSWPGVIFSHWTNQSFNAIVNYTNRSGNSKTTNEQLFYSYCAATGGATAAALGLNMSVRNKHGLAARLVPFVAVALANAINIPMIRANELTDGIELCNENDELIAKSRRLAALSIAQVTLSRIAMAMPDMVLSPVIMNRFTRTTYYKTRPLIQKYSDMPIQTFLAGIGLYFTTPLGCALFPQKSAIEVSNLEKSTQNEILIHENPPKVVFYNKGLALNCTQIVEAFPDPGTGNADNIRFLVLIMAIVSAYRPYHYYVLLSLIFFSFFANILIVVILSHREMRKVGVNVTMMIIAICDFGCAFTAIVSMLLRNYTN